MIVKLSARFSCRKLVQVGGREFSDLWLHELSHDTTRLSNWRAISIPSVVSRKSDVVLQKKHSVPTQSPMLAEVIPSSVGSSSIKDVEWERPHMLIATVCDSW